MTKSVLTKQVKVGSRTTAGSKVRPTTRPTKKVASNSERKVASNSERKGAIQRRKQAPVVRVEKVSTPLYTVEVVAITLVEISGTIISITPDVLVLHHRKERSPKYLVSRIPMRDIISFKGNEGESGSVKVRKQVFLDSYKGKVEEREGGFISVTTLSGEVIFVNSKFEDPTVSVWVSAIPEESGIRLIKTVNSNRSSLAEEGNEEEFFDED